MIVMKQDFSLNGTTLEKGKKLKIKTGFRNMGDIDKSVADALIAKGVAEMVKDEPKPKPTDNKQGKK